MSALPLLTPFFSPSVWLSSNRWPLGCHPDDTRDIRSLPQLLRQKVSLLPGIRPRHQHIRENMGGSVLLSVLGHGIHFFESGRDDIHPYAHGCPSRRNDRSFDSSFCWTGLDLYLLLLQLGTWHGKVLFFTTLTQHQPICNVILFAITRVSRKTQWFCFFFVFFGPVILFGLWIIFSPSVLSVFC